MLPGREKTCCVPGRAAGQLIALKEQWLHPQLGEVVSHRCTARSCGMLNVQGWTETGYGAKYEHCHRHHVGDGSVVGGAPPPSGSPTPFPLPSLLAMYANMIIHQPIANDDGK
jgi:hypothetical protein